MPLGRRRRPLMRAAMVGGGAYYAGKKVQENRDAQDAYAYEEPPQPAGGVTDDTVAQLEKLGELKEKGILTDEEFALQKQKLLASM